MKRFSVFVTYNSNSEQEHTVAVRLQTIGAVHGINMYLPDRLSRTTSVRQETEYRIKSSDYFILFSTAALTPVVQQEISTAFKHLQDKSKIIVIYDRVKNMKYSEHSTEVTINAAKESADDIVRKVIHQIKENQGASRASAKKKDEMLSDIGGILLIGLGFLKLDAFFNSKK